MVEALKSFLLFKGVYIGNCGTDWMGVKDLTQYSTGDLAKELPTETIESDTILDRCR